MSTPLPVLNRALDNTALSAFATCEREYFLAMFLHRRRDEGRAPALAYGAVMHVLLEHHYKTDGNTELAELVARAWWEKHGHSEVGEHRTIERAVTDYRRYRERWGQKPSQEQGRTIGFLEAPMIELPFDIQAGQLTNPWAGKIDRIIDLGGHHYIEDHKTTSRLDANYYNAYEMSNQMMGYVWAARHLAPQLNIKGVRLNVIHILKEKTGFERQIITYTREQLEEWESNTEQWIQKIRQAQASWPTIEQLQEGAAWPTGHYGDNGCSRKYGLCGYFKICSLAPSFRLGALLELPVNEWDPRHIHD